MEGSEVTSWTDLLFGSMVGFSAVLVIGFMLIMAVCFIIYFMKLSGPPDDKSDSVSKRSS